MFTNGAATAVKAVLDIFAIISLLQINKKIEATKEYRELVSKKSGYDPGLASAKIFIEELAKSLPQYTAGGSFIFPNKSEDIMLALLYGRHIKIHTTNGEEVETRVRNVEAVGNNRVLISDFQNCKWEILMQ